MKKNIFMAFKPLASLFGLFGGKDNYTKTRFLNINKIINGKSPQYVSIEGEESLYFDTTPQIYNVVMTKGQMFSNGIFKHVAKDGKEIENSEYVKLLNNPNPLQSRNEWLMEEMIHTSVFGNSFIYCLKGFESQKIPTCLYNLPAKFMKVIPTGKIYQQTSMDGIIEKFCLRYSSGTSQDDIFYPKDVIFSHLQNSDNKIVGKSPLIALMMPISNIRGAYGFRNILINEHGAIGILSNQAKDEDGGIPIDEIERKRISEQYQKDFGMNEGQSKVLITSASLSWQPMVFPTKDLMLFEEITADFMAIIDAYGMNEYLFSKEKGSTFANLNEGKKMAYQDTIIPYANNFSQKLTQKFELDKKGEKIILDYSHIECLQDNEKEKAETDKIKTDAVNNLIASGLFTTNEIKEIIKF